MARVPVADVRGVRVCYVTTSLQVGGAERVLYDLATRLDRRRFEPSVIALQPMGPIGEALQIAEVPVEALGIRSPRQALLLARLAPLIRRTRPHIVHTHLFHANVVGRLAARIAGVPRVVSSVHIMERERAWHPWLEAVTSPLVDVEVCVGASVREFMADAGVPEGKLAVIENGVDLAGVDRAPATPRDEVPVPDGVPFLLTVARLHAQKGLDVLLQAASLLRKRPFRWVVAGEGRERDALLSEARRLHVDDVVRLPGFRADAIGLMKACDVFVLPSRWEGLPIVLLEAMAAGRPVIATRVGGNTDLVVDGETGLLVPPEDPAALAAAIERLLADPALSARIAARGQAMVRERYSVERMVRSHEELYDSLRNPRMAELT